MGVVRYRGSATGKYIFCTHAYISNEWGKPSLARGSSRFCIIYVRSAVNQARLVSIASTMLEDERTPCIDLPLLPLELQCISQFMNRLATPVLLDSQIEEFNRDALLHVPGGFGTENMALIEGWTTELAELPEITGRQWVFHEESQTDQGTDLVSRIEKMSPFHSGFADLAHALMGPAGQLLGEKAVLFKEKINFKMPGGDGFKPHQDSQAGWEDYAPYFITIMVCIDEANLENGCLQVVPGKQNRVLYREWEPLTDDDLAEMDFQPTPTLPGDLVLFDSYTPHYSEPNLSTSIRRLYFATYNKASAGNYFDRYHDDKYKNYPPDIDRDPNRKYVFRV